MTEETRQAIADAWCEWVGHAEQVIPFVAWVESTVAPILTADLQAENERLTAFIAELEGLRTDGFVKAQAEVVRLRTALTELRTYVKHPSYECGEPLGGCKCGLSEVLKRAAALSPVSEEDQ